MTTKLTGEQAEALNKLRGWIKPGDTVYTILRNVSRSGMKREVGIVVMSRDHEGENMPLHPNYAVAALTGLKLNKRGDGIVMGGCGMDMGFALVYELSAAMFRNGFTCTGDGCPSNDHSNGDRDHAAHRHTDPGYALRHEWL